MSQQIFYIDPLDDLNKARELLKKSSKNKVVLVLPEENTILKNIENLTILKKEAQNLGKRLAVFSSDPQYKKLAEDCGIEIESSLRLADAENKEIEKEQYKKEVFSKPRVSDILPPQKAEPVQPSISKKIETKDVEKSQELPIPQKATKKWVGPLLYTIFFLLLVGGAVFSFTFLPRATITIVPVSEEIDFSGKFEVKKGADIDLEANIVPGTIIEKSKNIEKSFLATKTEDKEEKARGKITIYNEDTSSHRFVPGTRFKSQDGKIFKSQDWINIPAGSKTNPGQIEIEVVAESAGEEYNIEPTTFTVPGLSGTNLFDLIYAKSSEAMSGGFVGKTKVVGEEDIEKAKKEIEAMQDNVIDQLKKEILKEISPDLQSFFEDLIQVEKEEIVFDKKAGDIVETFKASTKVTVWVLSFEEDDVQEIIAKVIAEEIKEGVDFEEVVSSQKIDYEVIENNMESGVFKISFEGKEKVAWKVTADQIKKAVIGMDQNAFQKYISEDMKGKIKDGEVELWPLWVKEIPQREDRIFVEIKYE